MQKWRGCFLHVGMIPVSHKEIQKKSKQEKSAVANLYPNRELDLNESVLTAVFHILRRQPWKTMAHTTWAAMKHLFLPLALLAALLGAWPPAAAAQARNYDVLTADVPFKFNIGNRTFRPGHYEFVFAGAGLIVLRDARAHAVASLITRSIDVDLPSTETKLIFKTQKKQSQLARICIENRSQVLEVVGEELAMRQAPAPPPPLPPNVVNSLFDRRSAPGMKQ
jgi:hypothetical protein